MTTTELKSQIIERTKAIGIENMLEDHIIKLLLEKYLNATPTH